MGEGACVERHVARVVFGVGLADEFEIDEEHIGGAEDIGCSAVECISLASGIVLDVYGFSKDELFDKSAGFDGEWGRFFSLGEILGCVCAEELVASFGVADLEEDRIGIKDTDDLGFDESVGVWEF